MVSVTGDRITETGKCLNLAEYVVVMNDFGVDDTLKYKTKP